MLRWKPYVFMGVATALLAGLAAYQTIHLAERPRHALASAEDGTVAAIQAIRERMGRKRQVVGEVIAGRLSLLEAAAVFRHLDAEGPSLPPIRARFPFCSSDDEAYCRSVVEYVQEAAPPDQREELAGGLRNELETHLRKGTLHLAEPGGWAGVDE